MKKFFMMLAVLFTALQVMAQRPVTVTHEVKLDGDKGTIEFVAQIEDGYHVYSTDIPAGGPKPTSLKIREIEGAELVGSLLQLEEPETEFDQVFGMTVGYFEYEAVFSQKFKVTGENYRIKGTLSYQSCRDGACMPGRYDFEISGKGVVVAPTAPATPAKTEKAVESKKQTAEPKKTVENTKKEPVKTEKPAAKPKATEVAKPVAKTEPVVEAAPVVNVDTTAVDTVVAAPVEEVQKADVAAADTWAPVEMPKKSSNSLWVTFLLGLGGGLLALLTPCVWPIIPMTVSFFLKRSKERKQAIKEAVIYGASIIVIYLLLGLVVTLLFGADALNGLATNAYFNVFFFLMLLVFGASFLGGFELKLPSSWTNKVDSKASNTTGLLSIFLMAFTLALVSFSCTGPIIGFLLVEAATSGDILGPALGMLGFAIALALPFSLFAIFPSLLKQTPRSGGWMNTIKVVLGFVEIAFALKFLSVADLTKGWGILDRETFLALWIVLFTLLGLYLLKIIRLPHDDESDKKAGVTGFFGALLSLAFAVYMVPGLWGAPCSAISAFAPPASTQDFSLYDNTFKADTYDYDEAIRLSREQNKPIFLDFTGYGCVNCREMETAVLGEAAVLEILRDKYIIASLYVDDRTPLAKPFVDEKGLQYDEVGEKWSYLQSHKFGELSQPFYVLVDGDGKPLNGSFAFNKDVGAFVDFLKEGLDNFKK